MLSSDPCLLAVDTATDVVHLALLVRGDVHVRAVGGGAQASLTTLPAMQALLSEAGLAWPALDAIAFGRGPGAFTGLRTACSVTQGLAVGLDKPVLSLDTLMAVAEAARQASPAIAERLSGVNGARGADAVLWVLQDARMSEVYAAGYRWTDMGAGASGWSVHAEPGLWTLADLRERIASGVVTMAAGSALDAYPDDCAALRGPVDRTARPHGGALAALALSAWQRGEQLDAALALPLYVRDKVAQTTAERQAAQRSALAR